MAIQAPKGTKDVTPKESYKWQYIEAQARAICEAYGFREIRTPVIEHTELFLRGVGDTTDIVQKEMYTFDDKGGRSITLKPEGTAGAARMFLEHGLFNDAQPTKMYYLYCPVFRYDKPQAGRLREHHQFGVEVYGAPRASADAECIRLAMNMLSRVGVQGLGVHINSLRILDCKEESCQALCKGAPTILDCLCQECRDHFQELQGCLKEVGVDFQVDPYIVRGLDYYTKTVFEIIAKSESYTGTVCGGGRYDGLMEQLGGPKLSGVGFGMGMERLLLIAELSGAQIPQPRPVDVYIAALGEAARSAGFALADTLRQKGIKTEFDHVGRSFKAQFKFADKLGARYVAILGEDELRQGCVKLKDMAAGTETLLPMEGLEAAVRDGRVNQ